MSITLTTGTLPNSTASTGTFISLSGKAKDIYIRVDNRAYGHFEYTTGGSTQTGTGLGLVFSTWSSDNSGWHHISPGAPPPTYWCVVATGTNPYTILETY